MKKVELQNQVALLVHHSFNDTKLEKYSLIKVNILHSNGNISQIRLELPYYGMEGEADQLASGYLSDLVKTISVHHIDAIGFQVKMFSVNNGVESGCGHYPPVILKPECVVATMQ